jgi:hypothetical protein
MPDDHPHYSDCPDADCPRFPCRVWREGYAAGHAAGYAAGAADGYAQGVSDGAQAASAASG